MPVALFSILVVLLSQKNYYTQSSFVPGFYVFVLDAPYKFTPLLNLLSFIFSLKPVS